MSFLLVGPFGHELSNAIVGGFGCGMLGVVVVVVVVVVGVR